MKKEENATAKTTENTEVSTSSTGNSGYSDVVEFYMTEGRYPTAKEKKELGI